MAAGKNVRGLGVDLAEVARIKRLSARQAFLRRVFTPGELAYSFKSRNKYERLAARFAVKEAVIKALGDSSIALKDIEVENSAAGAPAVSVKGLKGVSFLVSISHTATHAVAAVIALK